MRWAMIIAALISCAPVMATAQDGTRSPSDFWNIFIARCSEALDAPIKITLDGLRNQTDDLIAMISTDGRIFAASEFLEDVYGQDFEPAFIRMGGERWGGAVLAYCTLQTHISDETIRRGMFEIAQYHAAQLLGEDYLRIGGPMIGAINENTPDKFTIHDAVFASGPFPAEQTLRVVELPHVAALTLTRLYPDKEN